MCMSEGRERPRQAGEDLPAGLPDEERAGGRAALAKFILRNHLRIMGLAEAAAYFACDVLRPGGTFIAKVLQGGTERELLDLLKKRFATVRHVKPPASRSDSAELYVVASGFRPG